jgi:hypothetical protein
MSFPTWLVIHTIDRSQNLKRLVIIDFCSFQTLLQCNISVNNDSYIFNLCVGVIRRKRYNTQVLGTAELFNTIEKIETTQEPPNSVRVSQTDIV